MENTHMSNEYPLKLPRPNIPREWAKRLTAYEYIQNMLILIEKEAVPDAATLGGDEASGTTKETPTTRVDDD
jgi:hypothetical protein